MSPFIFRTFLGLLCFIFKSLVLTLSYFYAMSYVARNYIKGGDIEIGNTKSQWWCWSSDIAFTRSLILIRSIDTYRFHVVSPILILHDPLTSKSCLFSESRYHHLFPWQLYSVLSIRFNPFRNNEQLYQIQENLLLTSYCVVRENIFIQDVS